MTEKQLSSELSCSVKQITACLNLISDGATVPFIARYRKEMTGSLNEEQIRTIEKRHKELKEFEKRKEYILSTLDKKGELTPVLQSQIESCDNKTVLEDIYLPYKQGKATRAQKARNAGLGECADSIWNGTAQGHWKQLLSPTEKNRAAKSGFATEEAIRDGIVDILSDTCSNQLDLRESIREQLNKHGTLESKAKRGWKNKESKFDRYYDYTRKASTVPAHVLSAIFRGENEGILSVSITGDERRLKSTIYNSLPRHFATKYKDLAEPTIDESYKRLLLPSLSSEQLKQLKEKSEDEACAVFADNLKTILLAPPAGNRPVLAIDPGFRTGCKVALLDEKGTLISHTTIYPTEPHNKVEQAADTLFKLYKKSKYELIAIGNGTGGRETEQFINNHLIPLLSTKPTVSLISEAGASIYSASKTAIEEFPDLDVTIRGAISIGRRLQDPLSELVKIPPESIGVGQYQHDVSGNKLTNELNAVIESAVNSVGADLNLASKPLLTQISGIGPSIAQKIVDFRDENGSFNSRKELLKVPGLGKKCFEQCAGFLRIQNSKNPLDSTAVHPENYPTVGKIAKSLHCKESELIRNELLLSQINIGDFVTDSIGTITLNDIIAELKKPARDPRKSFETIRFDERFHSIEDLSEGLVLQGIVTNVVAFGAFVDIGVHQDGLVHISELSNTFITNPSEVVKPGTPVTVKVIGINCSKKQISLSMKQV